MNQVGSMIIVHHGRPQGNVNVSLPYPLLENNIETVLKAPAADRDCGAVSLEEDAYCHLNGPWSELYTVCALGTPSFVHLEAIGVYIQKDYLLTFKVCSSIENRFESAGSIISWFSNLLSIYPATLKDYCFSIFKIRC